MNEAPRAPKRLVDDRSDLGNVLKALPSARPPVGARERVWRQLSRAPADRSRTFWVSALAGAACGVIVLAFALAPRSGSVARVALANGNVSIHGGGEAWRPSRLGEPLHDGAAIRTEVEGTAALRFEDAAAVLSGETVASVRHRGWRKQALEIGLGSGRVVVADDPRSEERAFSVVAGDYTVRVLGTIFSVQASASGVEVRVEEGAVEVSGPGTLLQLVAGESWSSVSGKGRDPLRAADGAAALSVLHPEAAQPSEAHAHPSSAASLSEAPPLVSPRSVEVVVRDSPKRTRHVAVQPDAAPSSPPAARLPEPAHTEALASASGGAPLARAANLLEGEPSSYELGKSLASRGDYREAVRAYQQAAGGTGPQAEVALYEVGRLELRQLGNPLAAVDAFRKVQTRFPDGQLRAEVQLSLIEALLGAKSYPDASGAMDEFLTRYPGSERRKEVVGLRADLRRQLGNCRGALEDYAALLEGPTGEEALYFSAFCQQKQGDAAAARKLLEQYRQRFPTGRHAAEVDHALFF